jgi:hypothetical protein
MHVSPTTGKHSTHPALLDTQELHSSPLRISEAVRQAWLGARSPPAAPAGGCYLCQLLPSWLPATPSYSQQAPPPHADQQLLATSRQPHLCWPHSREDASAEGGALTWLLRPLLLLAHVAPSPRPPAPHLMY